MSAAVLERDPPLFALPGDAKGRVLQLAAVDEDGTRWATAAALAKWLDVSERSVRKMANALRDSLSTSTRNHGSASSGAAVGLREVVVYSEGAWRLFVERGRKARARSLAALFARWLSDEGRLARAEAKGPLPFARAVLGIARDRLGPVVEDLAKGSDERELLADVHARLAEDRSLIKLALEDPQVADADRARIAHALPRGEALPDYARSVAATERAFRNRTRGDA